VRAIRPPAVQRLLDATVVALGIAVAARRADAAVRRDSRVALAAAGGAIVVVGCWHGVADRPGARGRGGDPWSRCAPALRRIGARDAMRNRSRTAATTGALLLATTVVAGLAVFLSSFAASIDGDVGELVARTWWSTRAPSPAAASPRSCSTSSTRRAARGRGGERLAGGAGERRQVPMRLTGIDGDALGEVLAPGWVGRRPS
jgi:hypothetical protein